MKNNIPDGTTIYVVTYKIEINDFAAACIAVDTTGLPLDRTALFSHEDKAESFVEDLEQHTGGNSGITCYDIKTEIHFIRL